MMSPDPYTVSLSTPATRECTHARAGRLDDGRHTHAVMVALALNTGLIPLAARPARAQKRVAARAAVVPKVRRTRAHDSNARARAPRDSRSNSRSIARSRPNRDRALVTDDDRAR